MGSVWVSIMVMMESWTREAALSRNEMARPPSLSSTIPAQGHWPLSPLLPQTCAPPQHQQTGGDSQGGWGAAPEAGRGTGVLRGPVSPLL